MKNKLYLIGIDWELKDIVDMIYSTPEVEDKLWEHFYMFEYDQDLKSYKMWNLMNKEEVYSFDSEKRIFNKMDEEGIEFLGNIPLGNIFQNYTAAYLEIVRWTADIYYVKRYWEGLIKE